MSAVELRNFESQLDVLSFAEQLAVVEYLVKQMKKKQEADIIEEKKKNAQTLFSLMDANPINMNGEKWTREELYER